MSTHAALVRGINVGKAKRVAMADLRTIIADLGYGDVRTVLNSGNAVFTAPDADAEGAAARIREGMATRLGVSAKVIVVTGQDIADVVADDPLKGIADDFSRVLVAFVADPRPLKKLATVATQDWTPDVLAIGRRVAYLWCATGILGSKLPESVGRLLGDGATTRNWATVLKLHAMMGGA